MIDGFSIIFQVKLANSAEIKKVMRKITVFVNGKFGLICNSLTAEWINLSTIKCIKNIPYVLSPM